MSCVNVLGKKFLKEEKEDHELLGETGRQRHGVGLHHSLKGRGSCGAGRLQHETLYLN